jgi:1-acyl-sn-glycerol-3-phosphate acyltransferase
MSMLRLPVEGPDRLASRPSDQLGNRAVAPAGTLLPRDATAVPATPRALAGAAPRRPSRAVLRFFDLYLSMYVPMHFRALRLASPERFPRDARPLIICISHPSWWDPLTSILLSRYLLRDADHYAPIDAASLPRYQILSKLGLFPVEQGTPRGAAQFLRAAQHILRDPNSLLWLTPQGSFTDVRTRPVVFKSGLGSLLKRLDHVTVMPLAYEYTFWDERKPEILAQCGEPLTFSRGRLVDASDISQDPGAVIAAALARTSDELAALAATRSPAHFHTVMAGDTHVTGLRATLRHLRAALRGNSYSAPLHHESRESPRP